MSAAKKGVIGIFAGPCVMAVPLLFRLLTGSREYAEAGLPVTVALTLAFGSVYGFGFIFGMRVVANWLSGAAGFEHPASLSDIFEAKDSQDGFLFTLLLFIFAVIVLVFMSYVPGTFIGIKEIYRESKSKKSLDKQRGDESETTA